MIIHLFRNADQYFFQILAPGQPTLNIYPDSQSEFFNLVEPLQISFQQSANGQVTSMVMHTGGFLLNIPKASMSAAEAAQAALQARIKRDKPSPGTEAALRRNIESFEAGHPNYDDMEPNLAGLARLEQSLISRDFQAAGALETLQFKKVLQNGGDQYLATFTHGELNFVIAPLAQDGTIVALGMGQGS